MQNVSKKSLFIGFMIPPTVLMGMFSIGIVFSVIYDLINNSARPIEAIFEWIVYSVVIIFLFSGIQSLIYTFVMHYKVFPRISSSFARILISGLLGGVAACFPIFVILIVVSSRPDNMEAVLGGLFFLLILFSFGFVVGLLSGWMLQRFYNVSQAKTVALKDETA